MYGWLKLLKETKNEWVVGYSWQSDRSCDGELVFDKKTREVTIRKLSNSADEAETTYLICPIRCRMREGLELGKLCMVATG